MPFNPDLLLAHLDARAQTRIPVVGAIYDGLAARVRRGDFNTEGGDDDAGR